MSKPSLVMNATVHKREPVPDWEQRQAHAQQAARNVMDVIQSLSESLSPSAPMDQTVEQLRMKPQPPAVLPTMPEVDPPPNDQSAFSLSLTLWLALLALCLGFVVGKVS